MARPGRPPDDQGYLPQARESEVLFTLIAERYERRSLGITSNLVYSEWERLRQPHGHRRSHRPGGPPHHYPRNSDGNPDSPQVVVFLATIVDVTVGS